MDRSLLVRRAAPVAVFAAVLGGVLAVNLRGHQPGLKALPLAAAANRDAAAGAPTSAEAKSRYGSGQLEIPDALLAGLPTDGPAHDLGPASDADVSALARALGIDGTLRNDAEGRHAGTGDRVLTVSKSGGHPWYLGGGRDVAVAAPPPGTADPDTPVTDTPATSGPGSSGSGSGSSGAAPCPSPAPDAKDACGEPHPYTPPKPPPMPSAEDARNAAAPVLAALGLGSAPVTVQDGWGTRTVVAAPVVGGLPTSGYETRLDVDVHGDITSGNGFLGTPEAAATYPLLDPRASVERGGPYGVAVDMMAPCLPTPAGTCASASPPPPREATQVRLGLVFMPSYDGTKAFLAPAWLLSFADSTWAEPVLALPDRYLEPPPTAKPGDGTEPGQTDPGPNDQGQIEPATGAPAKP
ncbi:MAG: hypothetical protein QOE45_2846 [Frankiaceae bacterium]|jgi:hypothetical protein|nr:hypothetical protein [Frankiaceae bacterium]